MLSSKTEHNENNNILDEIANKILPKKNVFTDLPQMLMDKFIKELKLILIN